MSPTFAARTPPPTVGSTAWRRAAAVGLILLALGLASRPSAEGQIPLTTFTTLNPQANAFFGAAIAMADVNGDTKADLIAGAANETVGGNAGQGRAYVFSGATGQIIYTLNTPNPQANGGFGAAVAARDLTGDGKAEIIVGAFNETVGANAGQGRVYVFAGATGLSTNTFTTPNPQASANFGSAIALGDVDGDAKVDIAASAPGETVGGNAGQGRVYVISGNTSTVIRTLTTPNPQASAGFGYALAAADVDGDTKADVIAGAPSEIISAAGDGRAYVFSGGLTLLWTFVNPNAVNSSFGNAVAAGEVDADNKADVAVGANGETVAANNEQGRVYLFSGETGLLTRTLNTANPAPSAYFGGSLAMSDLDGDLHADIAVGRDFETVDGNVGQGRGYVFSGTTGLLLATTTNPQDHSSIWPGGHVALGDVTGDGAPDVAMGAQEDTVAPNANQGRVSLFDLKADSDADACLDVRELGPDPLKGGQRDPLSQWDFFDVPVPPITLANAAGVRTHTVTLADAIAILLYVGTSTGTGPNANNVSYNSDLNSNGILDGREYDRTGSSDASKPWRSGPPSGAVTISDAIVALSQVGANCT